MDCKNIIMQGDSYPIFLKISYKNEKLDLDRVDVIQICIGNIVKYWNFDGSGEITYDNENDRFLFEISQKESLEMSGSQEVQVRIKFIDEKVVGKIYGSISLQYSNNKEEI